MAKLGKVEIDVENHILKALKQIMRDVRKAKTSRDYHKVAEDLAIANSYLNELIEIKKKESFLGKIDYIEKEEAELRIGHNILEYIVSLLKILEGNPNSKGIKNELIKRIKQEYSIIEKYKYYLKKSIF